MALNREMVGVAHAIADAIDATDLDDIPWSVVYVGRGTPSMGELRPHRPITAPQLRELLAPVTAELRGLSEAEAVDGSLTDRTRFFLHAAPKLQHEPGWALTDTPLGGPLRAAAWYWEVAYGHLTVGDLAEAAKNLAEAVAELATIGGGER